MPLGSLLHLSVMKMYHPHGKGRLHPFKHSLSKTSNDLYFDPHLFFGSINFSQVYCALVFWSMCHVERGSSLIASHFVFSLK